MSVDIESGSTITDTLSRHPGMVEELYLSLINVGEKSGKLDEIFDNVIEIIEGVLYLRKKLLSELNRAFFNIGGGVAILLLFVFVVIPMLVKFLGEFNSNVPGLIQIIYQLQGIFSGKVTLLLIFLFPILLILFDFYRSDIEDVAEYISYKTLKLPIIGDIIRWPELYVYFLVLKSCYISGLSIMESTQLANTVIKNNYLKLVTSEIHQKTQSGEPISTILKEYTENRIFEPEISELIEIGEAAGRVDESYTDVVKLLKEYIQSRVDYICSIAPIIGRIMAAAPVVFIILMVFSLIGEAAKQLMKVTSQIGL